MRERPRSVTVIGWILIVAGGDSLIRTTLNLHNPRTNAMMSRFILPIPIQHAFSCVGLLVLLVCGIGILKARNWARFLLVVWSVVSLIFACVNFSGNPFLFLSGEPYPGTLCCLYPLLFPWLSLFLCSARKPISISQEQRYREIHSQVKRLVRILKEV